MNNSECLRCNEKMSNRQLKYLLNFIGKDETGEIKVTLFHVISETLINMCMHKQVVNELKYM